MEIESDIPEDRAIKLNYIEIEKYVKMMEEMANAPKEEFGKRQPGEKGKYEEKLLEITKKIRSTDNPLLDRP